VTGSQPVLPCDHRLSPRIESHTISTEGRRRREEGHQQMITGLRGTLIWSEDVNNLLPFYRDVLGLEVTSETPGFVVLGGVWLGTHSEVHGRNLDPARHMIGLTSNDLEEDWQCLKDAGVEFIEDPTDYGTLRIATLKDPEGNLIQLLQS
jgi:predicted enzyme related to lactoylglutathione lyase